MTDAGGEAEEAPAEAVEEPLLVHGCVTSFSRGELVVHPDRAAYRPVVQALRDVGYQMCVDVTAVDYLVHRGRSLPDGVTPERYEVVANLLSLDPPRRIRVRVQVPEADPRIPSLFDLFPGADLLEREAYDMFGIVFDGHPDLSRLLMPDDWEGHPLRKDDAPARVPVQFKEAQAPR